MASWWWAQGLRRGAVARTCGSDFVFKRFDEKLDPLQATLYNRRHLWGGGGNRDLLPAGEREKGRRAAGAWFIAQKTSFLWIENFRARFNFRVRVTVYPSLSFCDRRRVVHRLPSTSRSDSRFFPPHRCRRLQSRLQRVQFFVNMNSELQSPLATGPIFRQPFDAKSEPHVREPRRLDKDPEPTTMTSRGTGSPLTQPVPACAPCIDNMALYSLLKLTALCALFHEAAAVRRQTPPLAPDYSSLPPVALPHGLTDAMQEPLF